MTQCSNASSAVLPLLLAAANPDLIIAAVFAPSKCITNFSPAFLQTLKARPLIRFEETADRHARSLLRSWPMARFQTIAAASRPNARANPAASA